LAVRPKPGNRAKPCLTGWMIQVFEVFSRVRQGHSPLAARAS
jgi:hypothetical protein